MSINRELRPEDLPRESLEVHLRELEAVNHRLMVERDEARADLRRLLEVLSGDV